MMTRHCHQCGREYTLPGTPGRSETCLCGADWHACLNCASHDPKVAEQCRDRRAEEVLEKARANFCEWFELARREWQAPVQDNRREDSARATLKRLLDD